MGTDAKCPGRPETHACREDHKRKRWGGNVITKGCETNSRLRCCGVPLGTNPPTSSEQPRHGLGPCKSCCCAGVSSCCRSEAESFFSSPPKSAAFLAQPLTQTALFFSSHHLDQSEFGGLAEYNTRAGRNTMTKRGRLTSCLFVGAS